MHAGLQGFEIELQLIRLDRRAQLRQPLIQRQQHRGLRIAATGKQQELTGDAFKGIQIRLGLPLIWASGPEIIRICLAGPAVTGVGPPTLRSDPDAVALGGGLLLGLGLLSAVAAARRVLAIDPVEATPGGGAR